MTITFRNGTLNSIQTQHLTSQPPHTTISSCYLFISFKCLHSSIQNEHNWVIGSKRTPLYNFLFLHFFFILGRYHKRLKQINSIGTFRSYCFRSFDRTRWVAIVFNSICHCSRVLHHVLVQQCTPCSRAPD